MKVLQRALWVLAGAAIMLLAHPGSAWGQQGQQAAQAQQLRTGTFGNWMLSVTEDRGLQIANSRNPEAVRVKLTHGSNGWFWIQTAVNRYVMWSAGDFTRQQFSFDDEKPDASAPAIAAGVYSYGQWTIRVSAGELSIEHSANPHRVVLVASSDGYVRIQGLRNRADLTIRPNDELATER